MNLLLQKEVRSILPAWVLAMVLATVPVWIVWPGQSGAMFESLGVMVFGPFGLGVLLLSITPFGQELNWGTFPVLLSQPISRRRLWLIKVAVVAVALGLAFLALCISNHLRVDSTMESMKHSVWRNAFDRAGEENRFFVQLIDNTRRDAWRDTVLIGGLEVLAGFAGGLWTTLLFRQVTAAFWVTLLVPMGLTVLASNLFKSLPDSIGRAALAVILGFYSAAGFLWAKRFFLRVQDTQWTGGVVALPSWSDLFARQGSSMLRRNRRPLRALVQKEFQAQQVNVLLAGGLLLVHLGVAAMRRWGAEYLATHQSMAMTLEMVPLLWLVMPLLIGSVVVAEERKLGTFQSNLCLPASRRVQFFTKLGVTAFLGVTLGGVLPLVIELISHARVTGSGSGVDFLGANLQLASLQITGCLMLTLLAFYASTLTRNGLQAMGAGLAGALLVCLVVFLVEHAGDLTEFILWRGILVHLIGWPVMILTILFLAYRNYAKLQPGIRLWTRNGATLLAALFCVGAATTVIFHRLWEAWLPDEPPHRYTPGLSFVENRQATPVLGRGTGVASGYLGVTIQDLTANLAKELKLNPWSGVLLAYVTPNGPADKAGLKSGDVVLQFDGKNFSDSHEFGLAVARIRPGSTVSIEIARDGANQTLELTISKMPDRRQEARRRRSAPKIVAAGSQRAVVLPEGRLWVQRSLARLVEQRVSPNQEMVIWYETGPRHTGFMEGSNWKDVALAEGGCFGIQTDGSLWDLSETGLGGTGKLVGQESDWESISAGADHFSALKFDGTLWQWGWRLTASGARQIPLTQVGADSDWTAVCDWWTTTAAIKTDGSVWRWDWHSKTLNHPRPWLTGACSQPVSFTSKGHIVAMVCADGTLWIGGEELTNSVYSRFIGGVSAQRSNTEMVRWRNDSDWKEIQFVGWGRAVGIKRDGTLWEWNSNRPFGPAMGWAVPPNFPSRYSDWMSIADENNAFLALARDGSLCLWGDPEGFWYSYWDGYEDPRWLLMPSRIKARRVADLSK